MWHFFFKEKTPEQYAANPYFDTGETDRETGLSPFRHLYWSSGTSYRFRDVTDDLTDAVLLEFILNSPLEKDHEFKGYVYILQRVEGGRWPFQTQAHSTRSGIIGKVAIDREAFERKRWDQVRKWISKCSSHSVCKARRCSPGFRPTRLVHVPYGPLALDPHYYLIKTTTHAPEVLGRTYRYITLSHCWGKDKNPSYRTTTENVTSRLKAGIPWRELPPTFQDAILAARRLRIPYLWIDSLCIVQEGVDCDWAVESSKMADIYMNSFLNLSATSASSSLDGLSSSFELHPRIVKTSWSGERGPGWYRIIDLSFWRDRVADAKVNTRGWVL